MLRAAWLLCACSFLALAQNDLDRLPVKRVVLYKNGVGYFEHQGPVRDNQEVAISFTSGQLNDVLKSLTVLDLNGGRIGGVEYGSAAPIDKQLGDLRLPIGERTSLNDFLGALRGAKIEVHTSTGSIGGRLLSVERKTRTGGGATLEVDYVSLLTDSGEVKTTELTSSSTVKLLDRGLAGKVDRYLDIAGASREADVRRMTISAEGKGDRSVFVSYISEVPVWKATYRIVLNPKKAPLLQGWAIVDNTVGQDWDEVELSLVAGAPQSFVQNLSQPYYARRPVVPLPEAVASMPQTYEATLTTGGSLIAGVVMDDSGAVIPNAHIKAFVNNVLAGETATDGSGRYELDLPPGNARLEVDHVGFRRTVVSGANGATENNIKLHVGSTTETVTVTAGAAYPLLNPESAEVNGSVTRNGNVGRGANLGGSRDLPLAGRSATSYAKLSSGALEEARSHSEVTTRAQELGDLFEYKLKDPITIQKNRSALVPIIQSPITAEKVSIWNERSGVPRPQRALWINNSSGLTLDGGSFSVLEDETFAGEGIFDPIRPGEKRLVSYATDLALNVSGKTATDPQRVTRVKIAHGVMTFENEVDESKTYTFRNEDTTPRTVIVEHPVRPNYQLRSEVKPVETTPAWMRFQLHVDPKQTASLVVAEARPIQTTYQLHNITDGQVAMFVRQRSIDKTVEAALRKIIDQSARVDKLDEEKEAKDQEMQKIFDDQQRLRENMKALKGSVEEKALLQRYTKQLNDQEDTLAKLRKESEDLAAQKEKADAALDQMIEELSFDVRV